MSNPEESEATWDVLANQVPFASMDFEAGPKESYRMDQWDGYVADPTRSWRRLSRSATRS